MTTWILGLMFGATLTISAVATGGLFGWPTAGIAAAGVLALLSIGRDTVVMTARKISELQSRADESQMDALTGLANRRGFDARLSEEVARSRRYGHALSLLMIDIDDFKQVNDRFGHGTGDESLRATARAIESSVRSIDIAARYGGEEFAVILPETTADGAVVVAERIRRANESSTVPVETTVSIGGAELDPSDADGSRLIASADAALYVAKRSGKNRVELAG
ncbi:MAG: GGDEF domain-containing protein [Thermomicrobiales bacterium]